MNKYYISIITIVICLFISVTPKFILQNETKHQKILEDIKTTYLFIIDHQDKTITKQEKIIQIQGETIRALNIELGRKQIITVSFYHPKSKGINSDSDHTNTATMTRPIVGRTIAISDELFNLGWLGNKIYIDGFGVFLAEDRMGSSIKGKCIDICVSSEKRAFRLGKKYDIIAMRL